MGFNLKHNYLLGCCVFALLVLCFLSIYSPIRFKREQAERETVVKRHLLRIRLAEEKYRAATGTYTSSFDSLTHHGYLAGSLQFVPYTDHKRFDLETSVQLARSGRQLPLMECRASYADFLQGLDARQIRQLIENENAAGRYPGLKIGDLVTPNDNAGNWE